MTLARALAGAISALFFVVLLGVEALNLRSARTHLQHQLESTAQDAATSLGLSLGTLLRGGADAALAETVVNPVFDRGHYERIEYLDAAGARVVAKTLPPQEGDYPGWLPGLLPLDPPTAESLVTAGWRQLGKVRVKVHPRFAYEQMWTQVRDTLVYLAFLFGAALLALRLLLRQVLRPLAAVEQAAAAISERNFVTLGLRPATRELARVVNAMNALSRRVRETIEAEVRRAEKLQEHALRDAITGLLNANGFATRFQASYQSGEEPFTGALAAVQLARLGALNEALGGERCNLLLRSIAAPVAEAAAGAGGFAGRWSGSCFAAALPGLDGARAREVLAELCGAMRRVLGEFNVAAHDEMYSAAVQCTAGATYQQIARALDESLQRAREQPEGVVVAAAGAAAAQAEADPESTVLAALEARRLALAGQPVSRMSDHRLLHTEIFARLRDAAGREILAGVFIPVIAARGLVAALDRAVIEAVLTGMKASEAAVSVNVSMRSVADPAFVAWLNETLRREPGAAGRLAFELAEHGVVQDEPAALAFAAAVRRAGAAVALDHFGIHRDSIALMQRLRPAYVKLAAAHTGGMAGDAGTRFFVESLVRAAHELGIPMIAQQVEDDDVFRTLSSAGFAGYQGNLGGRPQPWA